ncbi:hypothetical protein K490DRAFT_62298 [Saccharata proteae CBS 121410]|uniref:ATPase inhibitor, mitochondrial n=1 Tax=Saccharata proteae CBS 121410 TaxID=1314787 RepID=A0A9P4I0J5_9PEZI|nr:hypothetical protein K490DRAFT_62298 [Saccharata proteae CBS 121410]
MLRTTITRAVKAPAARTFSTSVRALAAGDTGAIRPGGEAAGDAFQKREKANEAKYIKEKEMEKLQQLKQKLAAQRQHIDELEKHLDDLTEQNGRK